MILGTGVDIVELNRIEEIINRQEPSFLRRILTKEEWMLLPEAHTRKIEFIAGRFAAKEACAKALGTGFGKSLSFQDIQVLRHETGQPVLYVSPDRLQAIFKGVVCSLHVSLSHSKEYAIAQVIVEKQ